MTQTLPNHLAKTPKGWRRIEVDGVPYIWTVTTKNPCSVPHLAWPEGGRIGFPREVIIRSATKKVATFLGHAQTVDIRIDCCLETGEDVEIPVFDTAVTPADVAAYISSHKVNFT